jgi:hypothetical protein
MLSGGRDMMSSRCAAIWQEGIRICGDFSERWSELSFVEVTLLYRHVKYSGENTL